VFCHTSATFRDTDVKDQWVDTLTTLFRFALDGATEVVVHVVEKDRKMVERFRATAATAIRNDMRACVYQAMDRADSERVKANVSVDSEGKRMQCFDFARSDRISWSAWHSVLYEPRIHAATGDAPTTSEQVVQQTCAAATAKNGAHARVRRCLVDCFVTVR
jgi:hypothetical protein